MLSTLFVNTKVEVTALSSFEEKEEQFREQVHRKPLKLILQYFLTQKFTIIFPNKKRNLKTLLIKHLTFTSTRFNNLGRDLQIQLHQEVLQVIGEE